MRIKHLLSILLALPLFFVACEPDKPVNPTPDKEYAAELTLTSEAEMNFDATGGEGEITYTAEMVEVTREVAEPKVEATCEADWVTDLTVAENITFTVTANEAEARDTKVVVTYGDKSFEVAVKQAAKGEEPEPDFVMDVELAAAMRIPSAEVELTDNNFVLFMTDDAENIELGIVLVGAEGETILQAGDYVGEDGSFMADGCELYTWDPEGYYRFTDGAVTVALADDIYSLDIELLSEDEELFHFTFEGPILEMVPSEKPEAEDFVPVKVEAYREATWDLGNFSLDLYINDNLCHSLDMQDNVNPNDKYLSAGEYSYKAGTITSWSNFIHNIETGEGAYVVAAEIDLTHNEDGTSTIKGYFESEHGKRLNVDWTGVIAGFDFSTENPEPQPGEDVEFTATYFGGTYYNVGNHNYYIVLSDVEVDGSSAVDGATYYYFDIYSNNVNDDHSVPNGVYTFDASNSYASGTFTEEYGFGFKVNGTESLWYLYAEGSKITVSDNKIVAELVLTDGTKHVVTYEGSLALSEASEGGSSLTGDLELNETGWDVIVEYHGQYYSDETDNYYVSLYEDADSGSGKWFVLDLMADYATCEDHSGTFVATEEYPAPNTFYTGLIENGYLAGSWYAEIEDGEVAGAMAPLMEGTITVTFNADDSQTYVFDCKDDMGNKITGTVTANPYSTGYALNKSTKKNKTYTIQLPKRVVR